MGSIDVGLLLVRVVIAFILFAHSTQKSLGWFSGPGLNGSVPVFEKLGHRPAKAMVLLASTCELVASLLILLGAAVPLGAAIGMGTMMVAGLSLSRVNGAFWNTAGGGEYPLVLAAALGALAFTGGGALSVDAVAQMAWYGLDAQSALVVGVVAVLGGSLAAGAALARSMRTRGVVRGVVGCGP